MLTVLSLLKHLLFHLLSLITLPVSNTHSTWTCLFAYCPTPLDLGINDRSKQGLRIDRMLAASRRILPSQARFTPDFERLIKTGALMIYANRPLDFSKVPLGLLDPIFGSFCDSSTTINPTAKDNYAFLVLRYVMLQVYQDEISRETALHTFFFDHLEIHLHAGRVRGTSSLSDGHAFTSCGRFIRLLLEVKNEITGISSDPYFQAPMFYRDYLDKLKLDECDYLSKSPIPVMIVIVFGKYQTAQSIYLKTNLFVGIYLQITGVLVTAGGILSEPLTPVFSFGADPNDENHCLAVTRCLAALRGSLVALDQHYQGLKDKANLPSSQSVFPYKTSFISLAGNSNPVNFRYISRPFDDILFFLARAGGNVLAIKYTRQYSLGAHKLLSVNGLAPKLHGFERIPGGWNMVVMQYYGETHQLLSELEPKNRESYRRSIDRGVLLLHESGFVHGDLRASNVLVSKNHQKALIIDFDAAGEADKVVYPPNLNTADIEWPEGVEDGVPITKAHDNYMFDRLFTSEPTRSRWNKPR
jgi:hypothetical protein